MALDSLRRRVPVPQSLTGAAERSPASEHKPSRGPPAQRGETAALTWCGEAMAPVSARLSASLRPAVAALGAEPSPHRDLAARPSPRLCPPPVEVTPGRRQQCVCPGAPMGAGALPLSGTSRSGARATPRPSRSRRGSNAREPPPPPGLQLPPRPAGRCRDYSSHSARARLRQAP